ncbi:MAG: hypothetical protein KDE33_20550 [Bacteroidetes bacterium]|nr:hypothetical protein [Bacteroidota bacterium]
MNTTAILAEIVITGMITLTGILLVFCGVVPNSMNFTTTVVNSNSDIFLGIFAIGFSYLLGNLVNVISHILFDKVDKKNRNEILGNQINYAQTKVKIYIKSSDLKSYLDIRYSVVRLFRSSVLSLAILSIGFSFTKLEGLSFLPQIVIAGFVLVLALLSFLAYRNQVKTFYKAIKNMHNFL